MYTTLAVADVKDNLIDCHFSKEITPLGTAACRILLAFNNFVIVTDP